MAQLVCISPDSFPRCGQISLIATLANLIVVSLMSGAVGVKLVLYSSAAGRIRQVTRDHQIQRHVVSQRGIRSLVLARPGLLSCTPVPRL
jgi:hypothetical protein